MIAGSLTAKAASPLWCSSSLVLESTDFNFNFNNNRVIPALKSSSSSSSTSTSNRFNPIIICCNNASSTSSDSSGSSEKRHEHNKDIVPKLEPFSRSKFQRAAKDPPLIDKSEAQLADYCSTLEGENSYSCWQAYFELKDLEKESPKKEVERLIIEAGGVKSLIGCLHGVAAIHKSNKENREGDNNNNNNDKNEQDEEKRKTREVAERHVPDGLPKTPEEIEEEETARMPDSNFTRMLRHRGKHAAWYSPTPDHQSD